MLWIGNRWMVARVIDHRIMICNKVLDYQMVPMAEFSLFFSFDYMLHRLKNCAFVDFNNDGLAARAQSQLHRYVFCFFIVTERNCC
jgi:hypothetical protein